MAQFDAFQQDLPLFVEAGLIAIKQGDEDSAKKLFAAVGILDPKNSAQKTGMGLIALHKMDLTNAEKWFKEVLAVEPENYRTKAFLGFAYVVSILQGDVSKEEKVQKLKWGADIANEVLAKDKTPATRQLAQSLLDLETELHQKGVAASATATRGGKNG